MNNVFWVLRSTATSGYLSQFCYVGDYESWVDSTDVAKRFDSVAAARDHRSSIDLDACDASVVRVSLKIKKKTRS